jgi:H+/Cl- antiporter ClcA
LPCTHCTTPFNCPHILLLFVNLQGKTFLCGIDTRFSEFQDFRNDTEKRDFVACGAAAGVAAAFGAPIGGVLFSLEEGSSFWSTKLTWRAFFCAMVTVFTLYIANTAHSMFGRNENRAMFSFGNFYSLQGEQSNFSVWELALFMVLGMVGGLIGAYFNFFVMLIFKWREQHMRGAALKCMEVLLVVSVMSVIAMLSPLWWQKCTPLPVVTAAWSDQERRLVADLVPLYCDARTEYNELASLYLADSDVVIRQLFHFREVGDQYDLTFTSEALFLFFLPYLIMACVTYGTAVPAGMFVPSLTSGAAFGRLVGHLLHTMDNTHGTFADSGTYALMGAIAITGGIARMVSHHVCIIIIVVFAYLTFLPGIDSLWHRRSR